MSFIWQNIKTKLKYNFLWNFTTSRLIFHFHSLVMKQLILPIKMTSFNKNNQWKASINFIIGQLKCILADHWSFVLYDVIFYRYYKLTLLPSQRLFYLWSNWNEGTTGELGLVIISWHPVLDPFSLLGESLASGGPENKYIYLF